MDGREAMSLSGTPSYYMHRGISESVSGTQTGSYNVQPVYRSLMNPNILGQSSGHVNNIGSTFSLEHQPTQAKFTRYSLEDASVTLHTSGEREQPVKKKRGRPRKYGPDGTVSLGLSSPSMDLAMSTPKKGRGRPPGSGRKQQLASLGGLMNSSAGLAFAPHVFLIEMGEDIASKILSFAQQKARALCIMSASGKISQVSLSQPAAGGTVRYEGCFEILCLSGSYLVSEDGDTRKRTGGLNVSLSSPEGHIFGGVIGGRLIASGPVQVVAFSFVYGSSKTKEKTNSPKDEESGLLKIESTPTNNAPNRNLIPVSAASNWPSLRSVDMKLAAHSGIDLTRG